MRKEVLCAAGVVAWLIWAAGSAWAEPKVLLYHSFDKGLEEVDYSVSPVKITAGEDVTLREDGVVGKAVGFDRGAQDATVSIALGEPAPASGWTLAFYQRLDAKEPLAAPDNDLLLVRDQQGRPLLTMNKSGLLQVLGADGETLASMECFDALYWIGGEDIPLAITYDADGAGSAEPCGKLTVYFEARPYGCAYVDLGDRAPASIRLGGTDVASAADELYLIDQALPLRAIYGLDRFPEQDVAALQARMAEECNASEARPLAKRRRRWAELARGGQVFEAEAGAQEDQVVKGEKAYTASGCAFISSGGEPVEFSFEVAEAGRYVLALRYALGRGIDSMWPVRHPEAKTAWTYNFTTVKVLLDGEELGTTKLYPTGTYSGHAGDVDPFAWHALAGGRRVRLGAGEHTLRIERLESVASPQYDALLLSAKAGPEPLRPRWVDQYRIPPAWWVADRRTEVRGDTRVDTYTVTLRNRTAEPYVSRIALESDMLGAGQKASVNRDGIALKGYEEKPIKITFQTPADLAGSTGYLRVVLWNEESSFPMEYRVWNYTPVEGFAGQAHPSLVPAPDPGMQAKFREWLKTRDEEALTPELKSWAAGPDMSQVTPEYKALKSLSSDRPQMFCRALLGEQLDMLDMWMSMSAAEADEYLPDAFAEDYGYGSTWDRVANKLTGVWHAKNWVIGTEPEMPIPIWKPGGDLDLVTELTAKGIDYETWRKEKKEVVREASWRREEVYDVFMAFRYIRWCTMIGASYHAGVATTYPRNAGLPILAEAYYLTGDEKYAHKAVELARVFARKYTLRTKLHFGDIRREDRDWWGTRLGHCYQAEMARRVYQVLGVKLLDLCWDALTADQRDMLAHNFIRWGMYEASNGPLWDDPDKGAKVNREELAPFIAFAKVVGDPGPYEGLRDYFRLVNKMVLSDGIHNCSIGTYGGVSEHIGFLQRLAALGVDVSTDNPSLRNAFLSHPRFIFSCGSLQPIDDGGGGQGHLQLYVFFGCPSREQYEWGYELYGDELFKVMPDFIKAVQDNCNAGSGVERAERMRQFYGSGKYPFKEIWPALFVAKEKGMAMLRNRVAESPLDWVEVLFDYGKFGGRCHGHPCKLGILTAFNGQVGSQDYGDLTRNAPEGNNVWFMGGYSHNTVQVDFRSHHGAAGPVQIGKLREAGGDETLQWIDAESHKMYDGVYMRRSVFTTDAGVVDLYLCRSAKEHVYDWPYHNFGVASTEGKLAPTDLSDQGLLKFAEDARSAKTDGPVQVTWKNQPLTDLPHKASTSLVGEDVFVRLWALPQPGTELVLFAGPTVTTICEEKQIDYAMLRRRTASTVFAAVLEPWRQSTGPKIESVRALEVKAGGKVVPSTEAYALELTRADGRRQVFVVNYSGGTKTIGPVTTDAGVAFWRIEKGDTVRNARYSRDATFIVR